MAHSFQSKIVISVDQKGMIEYWSSDTGAVITSSNSIINFKFKSDTNLYSLAKAKTSPTSLVISPNGEQFVLTSKDKQIRLFDIKSGKLKLQVDESSLSYAVC